jgi:hypothetical protein
MTSTPARGADAAASNDDGAGDRRERLGGAFLRARRACLDRSPGDRDTVRGLVERARVRGDL